MHRNTPKHVQWEIPGGKVEYGETLKQTAIRELQEELGITVTITREVGSKQFEQDGEQHMYHWFTATITQGVPMPLEAAFDDLRYFSLSDMQSLEDELSANAQNLIHAVQAGEINL